MEPALSHQPTDDAPLSSTGRHGHDEQNLAEFPLVLLTKRPPKGMHTIEYQDYDRNPHTGDPVLRKVTITASGKYLLPTISDEEVLMALIYLTLTDKSVKGFDDSTVHFSRRQLLQVLGWPDTGPYYNRLKQSMRRWKTVNIIYENWWDSVAKEFVPEVAFNFLDNYRFFDGRRTDQSQLSLPLDDGQPQRMLCYIKWNETIFASFKNGTLTKLDLDTFFSLPTAAAKRAYRYLNVRLPLSGDQDFDLKTFACQHVGFSPNYKPSRLRSEVREAIVLPLEKNEFIERLPSKNRFRKRNGRDCIVFARKASAALPPSTQDQPATLPLEAPPPSMPSPLIRELTRRGLGGKLAAQFVADHPADYIEQKIDYFDFKLTVESVKRPGGLLRRMIEDDYGPEPGYLPREERERQAEAARRQQQAEADARRSEREEKARKEKEEQEADERWASLSPERQRQLEAEALADGGEAARQTYETMKQFNHGQGGDGYLKMLRRSYIVRLMREGKLTPADA